MAKRKAPPTVDEFINQVNREYEQVHKAYEDNFWATKMDLKGCSTDALTKTKADLDNFLGDTELLSQVEDFLKTGSLSAEQSKVLQCFQRTFKCYIVTDPEALAIRAQLTELQAELAQDRNKMNLGSLGVAVNELGGS